MKSPIGKRWRHAAPCVLWLIAATTPARAQRAPVASPPLAAPTPAPLAPAPTPPPAAAPPGAAPSSPAPPVAPPSPPPAAPPLAAAPPAAPCRGALDGHVVDAVTHEPVAGALVRIDGEIVGDTDGDGRFQLRALCAGPRALEIELAGYQTGKVTLDGGGALELLLEPAEVEVITVEGEAPPPIEMQATAELSGQALERARGQGLAEALAAVPGVRQLGTGSGLAKPIVRGQFGRRLVMLVDSVRHRAQDWGLDHAPEIDPFVADKLSVVRGAAGVKYGPDAIGGVLLVEPPAMLRRPGYAAQLHALGMSNGRGGAIAGRLQGAPLRLPGWSWQLDGSYKRLAATSTPDYALDNTGVRQFNLGAAVGYRRGALDTKLSFVHYQADLGVCNCLRLESAEDFFAQLDRERPADADLYRARFAIERPSQNVMHDAALSRTHWDIPALGEITGSYAFQHDHRREYEVVRDAVEGPQFDFRLLSHDVDLALDLRPAHITDHLHLRSSFGVSGSQQTHFYSGLPLIPDFSSWGGGVYVIERLIGHDFELEAGLRYDALRRRAQFDRRDFLRLVRSDQLAADECDDAAAERVGCRSTFHTVSASLGALRQLTHAWSIKGELSTASRPPNPDEQYLNGSAPTFPVVGLGDPGLRPETTYSASSTVSYQGSRLAFEASAYANVMDGYIYFSPAFDDDGQPIFDVLIRGTYPRFTTKAIDAVFFGADGGVTAKPLPGVELDAQVSVVRARNRTDSSYLVFVPADQVRGSVTYRAPERWRAWDLRNAFVSLSGAYTARQRRYDRSADFAPPPGGYFLLGAALGAERPVGPHTLKFALVGENLLDARYRDYTSLTRYFVDQPGWQATLRVSFFSTSLL